MAALPAGRPAVIGDARLLFLACGPSRLAVNVPARPVRTEFGVCRRGELLVSVRRPLLSAVFRHDRDFLYPRDADGYERRAVLAVLADRVIKGSGTYRTLLIWPYAVAPAIAGVLWLFMFNPSIGVATYWLKALGYNWNHVLNGDRGDGFGRCGLRVEADQL